MQTIRDVGTLRNAIGTLRCDGGRIALVPTMGALHDGHMTLVREAKRHAEHVVASIFVNPTQFGPNEDLDAYPRREAEDAKLLAAQDVAILWAPPVGVMYPEAHRTTVSVRDVGDVLCGAARPGHFDGVATVVAKLFQQVGPDVALFGEKDWQQLAVIRRMASDLDFALHIIGVQTVREADGLAMSSRNAYLSADQRIAAGQLPMIMATVAQSASSAVRVDDAIAAGTQAILNAGFASVDYLELRDGATLALLDQVRTGARLFAAARIGTTRLIDNIPVEPA